MSSGSSGRKTVLLIVIAVLAVASAAVVLSHNDPSGEHLGLTGNRMVLTIGEEADIKAYHIPDGGSYSDIVWTSGNTSVATVSAGAVRGVSLGDTVVKAELSAGGKTYSAEYQVHVAEVKTDQQRSYDIYSKYNDYAVLCGDGFENGLLSLSFNCQDNMVISLSGYKASWIAYKNAIGCPSADFDTISIIVKDSTGQTVVTSEYENGKTTATPGSGVSIGASCNTDGYTALIAIKGLGYGSYSVVFKVASGMKSDTVTGEFVYVKGDGNVDASGTYSRSYVWRFDGDNDKTVETHKMSLVFEYSEYLSALLSNSEKIEKKGNTLWNYSQYGECRDFCQITSNMSRLAEELKKAYTAAYGTDDYSTQLFAQYILAFCQMNFDYEMDNTQYYCFGEDYSEGTDYWAYPEETLFSGYGDCEDLSMLCATLYKICGFDSACVILPQHMICAVALEDYAGASHPVRTIEAKALEGGKTYYFCESTVRGPVREAAITGSQIDYTWVCSLAEYRSNLGLTTYAYLDYGIGRINSSCEGETFEFFTI